MNTNNHTSPKDFFLHLGATIALYASVIALIDLAFEVVNKALPDSLNMYFSASSVVWPISILIVLVPTLYVLEKLIGRDIVRMPLKKDLWIRRWRIYLTLFLTGATIAVDVIVLINTYLNGEISSRFIWKVVVVLVVSAIVFAYYILAKMADQKTWLKVLAILGAVIALAAIIAGFIIVGSPSTQRSMRFDEQRVSDLTNIQWQITNYWQKTGTLPAALEALNDPISNFYVPKDPETSAAYEYSVNALSSTSLRTFDLCATFDLPSSGDKSTSSSLTPAVSYPMGGGTMSEVWTHNVGHACFERTIDPKLYPAMNK
jgi:hypothetical protein